MRPKAPLNASLTKYEVVYDGEIWTKLDDGEMLHLKRGDVVVQNGTRHAWRNKGTKPATMLFS